MWLLSSLPAAQVSVITEKDLGHKLCEGHLRNRGTYGYTEGHLLLFRHSSADASEFRNADEALRRVHRHRGIPTEWCGHTFPCLYRLYCGCKKAGAVACKNEDRERSEPTAMLPVQTPHPEPPTSTPTHNQRHFWVLRNEGIPARNWRRCGHEVGQSERF